MHNQEIKNEAIKLRKEGYSYNYIVKQVPVAKSTLSDWLHDIPFKPNEHTIRTISNAHIASGNYKHKIRLESFERARVQAVRDIGDISKRDLMMLGLGIYIGEGGKTRGITRIANSDPKIIKFAIKWFMIIFCVKKTQFRVRLHIYPDNKESECIDYWSKHIEISKSQFFKSTIDNRTNKINKNRRKLPFGTAHMSVKGFGEKKFGVYLHRLIMAWINEVL